jgi:hypothetical protein
MSNALEISKSIYSDSRQYRCAVFRRLAPVYCAIPTEMMLRAGLHDVLQRELAAALDLLGESASGTVAFPHILHESEVQEIFVAFESDELQGTRKVLDLALGAWSEMENSTPRIGGTRRLRDIPELPVAELTDEMLSKMLDSMPTSFAELFKDNPQMLQFMELLPPEQRAAIEAGSRQQMREMMTKMRSEGPRKVIADSVGADLTNKAVLRQTGDEALVRSRLKQDALAIASHYLSPEKAEELSRTVALEHCPARWLKFQVEREIEKAEPKSLPSNEYDLMHVSHLPYVDLLFTDKRIRAYVEQVHRRHAEWPLWSRMGRPVHVSQSIDSLIDALGLLS